MTTPRLNVALDVQIDQRSLGRALSNLRSSFGNTNINVNTSSAVRNVTSLTSVNRRLQNSLRTSTGFVEKFGEAIGGSATRFSAYAIGTVAIIKLNSALRDAVREAFSLEKQLVRLSQVLNVDIAGVSGLREEILNLSTETGIASGKLGEISVTLAQAGIRGRELSKSLDAIAKSDLGPTFTNLTNTTEGVVAILRQFKLGADDVAISLSAINAVSKEFAVEADDIVSAVRRAGGVFSALGGNLNELIALFTSVRATTRESAETISVGLRTIFTRLQRPETLEFLKEFNVNLLDVNGNLKSPFEAVKTLSVALRGLGVNAGEGSLRFASLVEELGGVRQVRNLIPLINNFNVAQKALGVAVDDNGESLEKDFNKALKSVGNQVERLQQEFKKLFIEIFDQDSVKELIDGTISLSKSLIQLANSLKPIIPLLAAYTGLRLTRSVIGGAANLLTPSSPGVLPGFASGGLIGGRTGTDQNIIRASRGEFVVNPKGVRKFGINNLESINETGRPATTIPGFQNGGLIGGGSVGRAAIGSGLALGLAIPVFSALNSESEKLGGIFENLSQSGVQAFLLFKALKLLNDGSNKAASSLSSLSTSAKEENAQRAKNIQTLRSVVTQRKIRSSAANDAVLDASNAAEAQRQEVDRVKATGSSRRPGTSGLGTNKLIELEEKVYADRLKALSVAIRNREKEGRALARSEANLKRRTSLLARSRDFLTKQRSLGGGGAIGRGIGAVREFGNRNQNAIFAATAVAAIALNASLEATAEQLRNSAQEAEQAGRSQEAYNKTLEQAKAETSISNAQSGAAVGGTIGLIFGPLGAAIGAAVGGALASRFPGLVDFVTGKDSEADARNKAVEARRRASNNNINSRFQEDSRLLSRLDQARRNASGTGFSDDLNDRFTKDLISRTNTLISGIRSGSATTADQESNLSSSFDDLKKEFDRIAEPLIESGKGFDEIAKVSPEVVNSLKTLAERSTGTELQTAFDLLKENVNAAANVQASFIAQQKANLNSLVQGIQVQNSFNASLERLTNSINAQQGRIDNLSSQAQFVQGGISSVGSSEFGSALRIEDRGSREFNSTLSAISRRGGAFSQQVNQFRNVSSSVDSVRSGLLSPGLASAPLQERDKRIRGIVGQLSAVGATTTQISEFSSKVQELFKSGGATADEIDNIFNSITDTLSGQSLDNVEKARKEIEREVNNRATIESKITEVQSSVLQNQQEFISRQAQINDQFRGPATLQQTQRRRRRSAAIFSNAAGVSVGGNDRESLRNINAARIQNISNLTSLQRQIATQAGPRTSAQAARQEALVRNINNLDKAFKALSDTSQDLNAIQEKFGRDEEARQAIKGASEGLTFGGRESRGQFARNRSLAQFAVGGGNIQALPDELRSSLFEFLREFQNSPVFGGLTGQQVIDQQTAKFLSGQGFSQTQINDILQKQIPIELKQLQVLEKIANSLQGNAVAAFASGKLPTKGTDVLPAMLSPGEAVVRASQAQKPKNKAILSAMNKGQDVTFLQNGGFARSKVNISSIIRPEQVENVFSSLLSGSDLQVRSNISRAVALGGRGGIREEVRAAIPRNENGSINLNGAKDLFRRIGEVATKEYNEILEGVFGIKNGENPIESFFDSAIVSGNRFIGGSLNSNNIASALVNRPNDIKDAQNAIKKLTESKVFSGLMNGVLGPDFTPSILNISKTLSGKVPGFQNSGEVRRSGLALVHKGEQVIRPAAKQNAGSGFSMDSFNQTPPWLNQFSETVDRLSGVAIKVELAPTQVTARIVGAELLQNIDGMIKKEVEETLVSAISNIYHSDNTGRHSIRR